MKAIKTTLITFITFLLTHSILPAQTDIALEIQVYSTGFIPGISIDKHIGTKHVAYFRGGFNFFNHREQGEWFNEEGWGYGGSLGYKRYIKEDQIGLRFGIKSDVWFNKVDWAGYNSVGSPLFGTTDLIVLQPTLEVDYVWDFGNILIAPSVAFGMELNVKTVGEPTGQGAIFLFGIQLGQRIY